MNQYRDPWRQREAWRNHPVFSTRNYIRNFFPGFGIAVVAFTLYVAFDTMIHPSNIEAIKESARKDLQGHSLLETVKIAARGETVAKDDSS